MTAEWITDDMVERVAQTMRDEGSDSEGGWHSWRCFDEVRYPDPCTCTDDIARAALAAAFPDGPGVKPLPDDPKQVTAVQWPLIRPEGETE